MHWGYMASKLPLMVFLGFWDWVFNFGYWNWGLGFGIWVWVCFKLWDKVTIK
jgi:hypothetical protein